MSRRHLLGIFVISAAALLLELALTRVFSVALWYHFGFLVISTALLAFGAAGSILALSTRLRGARDLDRVLAATSAAFGVTVVATFWLLQRIRFDPFSLGVDRSQWLWMPVYQLLLATPFFFAGLTIALLLDRAGRQVGRFYASDLAGAAVGCVLVVLLLPAVGGSGTVVVAGALGLLAAAAFAGRVRRGAAAACVAGALALGAVSPTAERWLPITVTENKRVPPGTRIFTGWNALSRVDVFDIPAVPERGAPGMRAIAIDAGTAMTGISDLRGGIPEFLRRPLPPGELDSSIAYIGRSAPSVLIIGSAGGGEILDALRYQARRVVGVEINGLLVELGRDRMRDYWGDLFRHPNVEVVVEDGRSYVRRSTETFDAIISSHTISNAALASGALSLAENYVLTREAFADYFDHLTPDGALYFTRPELQLPRLAATVREVLEARGVRDVARHVYAYRVKATGGAVAGRPTIANRTGFVSGLVVRMKPFTAEEVAAIEQRLRLGKPESMTRFGMPERLYSPLEPDFTTPLGQVLAAPDLAAHYRASRVRLEPVTDDQPFFNQRFRWSALGLDDVRDVLSQSRGGRSALEDRPITEVTLIVLLGIATLLAGAFILVPLVRLRARAANPAVAAPALTYFACLGLGFIFAEMALLQRFTLFLGQPVYTLGAVLAGLLLFTGVGSMLASRAAEPLRALRWVIPAILGALAFTVVIVPFVFHLTLGLGLFLRVAIALLLLAPLGVALGTAFPTGLHLLSRVAPEWVPLAWGVNGFFTVIGTVLGTILGMSVGFTAVLALAAALYAVAGVASRWLVAPAPEAVVAEAA